MHGPTFPGVIETRCASVSLKGRGAHRKLITNITALNGLRAANGARANAYDTLKKISQEKTQRVNVSVEV